MNDLAMRDIAHRQLWVGWREVIRDNRKIKTPFDPVSATLAASDNPKTWATRDEAECWAFNNPGGGVGLMFAPILDEGLHLGGIDLDTCRDPKTGTIEQWALDIIKRFQTYTEISPSQTGVKLYFTYAVSDVDEISKLFEGKSGRSFKRHGGEHPPAIEVYVGKRYFAVTDDEIGDYPDLRQINIADLQWIIKEAGPKFTAANGHDKSSSSRDNSRSGKAFRRGAALKAAGYSYEQMREALLADDDPEIYEWARTKGLANGEREMLRIYENASANIAWPEPRPIPEGLLVAAFSPDFLPRAIAPWVMDIADRMQCPPDFVGIPAIVALGAVIGRKISVRPQRKTDWYEVANLWGCIVGRPGVLKSPAMKEALRPLRRLEISAREDNEAEKKNYAARMEFHKLQKENAQKRVRNSFASGAADASSLAIEAPESPKDRRYIVDDASYEKLGEVLADNPNGVLAYRDELISLLKTLDREECVSTRGFYLSAWSGKDSYTFDRIIRGQTYIKAACISMLGSTQPGRLIDYLGVANSEGAGDDGLIQRFGLFVWPDQSPEWHETDRYALTEPKSVAWQTFERLDKLTAETVGAQLGEYDEVPFLRFAEDAQSIFSEWRRDLETRLRSGELSAALESHLGKYRKLVPALALINHLADEGAGPIGETPLLRALSFVEYLETHANIYGAGADTSVAAAKSILKHIRRGDLKDGFTGRDIQRSCWADLSDRIRVLAGLDLLAELNWLRGEQKETGGRPTVAYQINPEALNGLPGQA